MNENEKILVVDDEKDMLENCRRMFSKLGYEDCLVTTNPAEALDIVGQELPALVLTDMKMPGMDGIELLKKIKGINENIIVIVFTAHASVETAVMAVKEGAFDYIPKPFSFDHFSIVVRRALSQKSLMNENVILRKQLDTTFKFDKIIGGSLPLLSVLETVKKICGTETNVLIHGESGTGKELIARSIHVNSARMGKPFIPVDCASLPETLLETELFGHEKGAFTGAVSARTGLFELANTGTFFLDEVADLSFNIQAKLLRVLQERKIRRVGGGKFIDLDIRVISSTNRDIEKAVAGGEFREDLYYRLNVISIHLPPLRERAGDIGLLADHYLKHYTKFSNKDIAGFTKEALDALETYRWPGNIRELKNVVERAVSLSNSEEITIEDLPVHMRESEKLFAAPFVSPDSDDFLPYRDARERWTERSEKKYVCSLLEKADWNISMAAKEAQVDRKTFYKLLRKHNVRIDRNHA